MKHTEIAVTEREKQLNRQAKAAANPLIREILEKEAKELREEWTAIKVQKHTTENKK